MQDGISTAVRGAARRGLRGIGAALCLTLASAATAGAFEMPASWISPHFRDHPLVGTILTGDGAFVAPEDFARRILGADYVLAGETHDNADHHLLQARIVGTMTAAGDRPAIVFEMIATDLAPALDAYLAAPAPTADGLGAAVKWSERGWPDFAIYRPIVETALASKLPLAAGDLPRETIRRIGKEGARALPSAEVERLGLQRALPAAEEVALSATLKDGHCGMLPEAAVAPMLTVQRARDGSLANAVLTAARAHGGGKAVLVAGSGHVRKDWAVPALIAAREPDATMVSVAMMEVSEELRTPADYGLTAADPAPYDYILFTPRGDISDPCAGMAEAMGRMRDKAEPAK